MTRGAVRQALARPLLQALLCAALAIGAAPARADSPPERKLTADDCVAIALRESGLVAEAKGKVTEWAGRLAEVESIFYPKLVGLTYLAPLYRVRGSPLDPDVERDFTQWGPYAHFQAVLAQPLYTFGRAAAGERAAKERLEVERARYQQARNVLALEVRKFYHLHLFTRSIQPALDSAKRILDEAETQAEEMYQENSGKVTKADLAKLRFGGTELEKYRVQAQMGESLSLAALKHTMGLPESAPLSLAHEALAPPPQEPLPPLAELLQKAAQNRPEVAQLRHGKAAALSLEEAERLANLPVVFAAGQLSADWTPMWPDSPNPFHYDRYNDITGGVALGLQFDLDPAKAKARGDSARGIVEQVDGLAKFAATGLPLEVRKAHDDVVQAERLLKLAEESAAAGKKWMIFAGSAYVAGTGEAKDLLEGLAAYLSAKKGYYDQLQALHLARAQILYVTGETGAPAAAAR